jgi:hypothetical protein
MCRKPGCEVYKAQRQTAYMLMRRQRSASGALRFADVMESHCFEMGCLEQNFGAGFAVLESPEAALECTPRLHDKDVVVVRGMANGVGYLDRGFMFVPQFRPVCAVDLVVGQV